MVSRLHCMLPWWVLLVSGMERGCSCRGVDPHATESQVSRVICSQERPDPVLDQTAEVIALQQSTGADTSL